MSLLMLYFYNNTVKIRNNSLDYGLIVPFVPFVSDSDFVAIPWLGVMVPFGRKKTARSHYRGTYFLIFTYLIIQIKAYLCPFIFNQ